MIEEVVEVLTAGLKPDSLIQIIIKVRVGIGGSGYESVIQDLNQAVGSSAT